MKLSFLPLSRLAAWFLLLAVACGPGCAKLSGGNDQAGKDAGVTAASPGDDSGTSEAERKLLAAAMAQDGRSYHMQAGDEIDLQIYREPDMSGVFRISPDGDVRHPLLGNIALAGFSIAEAELRLTELLAADYLVNPRVIIKVLNARSSQIVIFGEVKNPGIYPVPVGESITLLQAIAQAGGFTELASPDRVRIVREKDGKQTTIKARVADILGGKGKQGDIPLLPDDVIVVPQIVF